MVRLAHYMGIVHPGSAFEVSTTSIQLRLWAGYHEVGVILNKLFGLQFLLAESIP